MSFNFKARKDNATGNYVVSLGDYGVIISEENHYDAANKLSSFIAEAQLARQQLVNLPGHDAAYWASLETKAEANIVPRRNLKSEGKFLFESAEFGLEIRER